MRDSNEDFRSEAAFARLWLMFEEAGRVWSFSTVSLCRYLPLI